MPLGTASARLKKKIMFQLVQKLGRLLIQIFCYRCTRKIDALQDFGIQYKEPWLDVDSDLFWNLENIAFSHLSCNVGNRRQGIERNRGENGTEWCSSCKKFLNEVSFGRMNKKNYTRPVKYHCNECRKANGWDKVKQQRYCPRHW